MSVHLRLRSNTIRLCHVFAAMLLLTAFSAIGAEVLELPEDELSRETVLPVFDSKDMIRNRNVVTNEKIEANLFYGYAMTEPIFNFSKIGLAVYYNSSEENAWGLLFANNSTGLSNYSEQLNKKFGFDMGRAPAPEYLIMGDYNLKMLYGKMSVTRNIVFNTTMLFSAAAGVIKYSHKAFPAIAPGIGQKFYFTKNLALRFDMRLYVYQAPSPVLNGRILASQPKPTYDDFSERTHFTTNLEVGLSYLF